MLKTMKYKGKNVLVMGLARSGMAAARILKALDAHVVINDGRSYEDNADAKEMEREGFQVICGGHPMSLLETGFDLIVKNPGIPYKTTPLLLEAQKRKIPIVCEVEIAYAISEAPFIGITATNGKTTTTTLIHEMMQESGIKSKLAGNIGFVSSVVAKDAKADEVLVTELSSFQLMGIEDFRPHIGLILNITEAHLDYHTDLKEYRQAKLNLVKKQLESDFFVYNADDDFIVSQLWQTKGKTIPFSQKKEVEGAYLADNALYYKDEAIIAVDDILLKGEHNMQDVLGAVAVCKLYGATNDAIVSVLCRFSGVKHRLQFVKEVEGVKYYNNSKATNVIATQTALRAFEQPVVLIAGGLDRDHDLEPLAEDFKHIKGIFAFGQAKERFLKLAKAHGIYCEIFDVMEGAFEAAVKLAEAGDVLLLAPACASWDQYVDFEERGDAFIEMVEGL
ncbi:MAG: UDP-N-acetylmuramoyl-L-alanine--D-glutamate ligase [Defluviitaleaceae bacterium]|nr:UDP-N-acetylmuramoyl-L-alanine--D-glutamate ligase [Defluviitaleaceae bacterium]